MEITITRALAEKKMLLKRIENGTLSLQSVSVCTGKKPVNGFSSNEDFVKNSDAMYQSVVSLIGRLEAIETEVANSNATTMVTICEKEMTVASAIKRKTLIKLDETLLRKMKNDYQRMLDHVEKESLKLQVRLDDLITKSFTSGTRPKEDDILAISRPFMEANEVKMVTMSGLKEKIEVMGNEIDEFLLNVDFALSESNSTTKITIPD